MPKQSCRVAAVALGLIVVVGCSSGPKPVIVEGSFTNGGKPIAALKNDGVTIMFVPASGGTSAAAMLDKDVNRYKVSGPTQTGILPGKYKISINIMSSKPPAPGNDDINAKYSLDKTPIEVEVPADGKLDIDLANFKPK